MLQKLTHTAGDKFLREYADDNDDTTKSPVSMMHAYFDNDDADGDDHMSK